MSGWSMVWLAPVWRNSGGRSAVSRIMGTPSVAASTTASAATRGVERDPGATQKKSTPQRKSSSMIRYAQRRLACGVSLFKPEHSGEVADLLLDLGPLLLGHGAGDDPSPREEGERLSPHEPRAQTDGELGGFRPDPTDGTRIPAPVEGFEGPYLLPRLVPRIPADGGGGVHGLEQPGVGHTIFERPANLRPQMP